MQHTIIALSLVLWAFPAICEASISKSDAVDIIIGEAEGESYQGKLAIAQALRHRGYTRGCYGLHAPRVKKHLYSSKTFVQAVKAWEESRTLPDITGGATGWGNAKDIEVFKRTKWWKKAVITAKIGNHFFYKTTN